jgi:hypothetical protein
MRLIILLFYIVTMAFSCAQAESVMNLEKIGKALGFPPDQLFVADYLEIEKLVYTNKTPSETSNNTLPPFSPDRIYKAYKITGKNPATFLPIIITVVARDTYRSELVKKLEIQLKPLAETPMTEGGRLPLGEFKVSESVAGFFLSMPETRVPAQPIHLAHDPPGLMKYVDNYPTHTYCHVSFVNVPESDVDIRIAQYGGTETYEQTITPIAGGEKYFNRFGHLFDKISGDEQPFKTDEPFHEMIINVFRGLNLEVLDSPMLDSFRKNKKSSATSAATDLKTTKSLPTSEAKETPTQEKKSESIQPQRQDQSWLWIFGLIALLSILGLSAKYYFSKRSS